jgi:hypothetical protein
MTRRVQRIDYLKAPRLNRSHAQFRWIETASAGLGSSPALDLSETAKSSVAAVMNGTPASSRTEFAVIARISPASNKTSAAQIDAFQLSRRKAPASSAAKRS